MIVARLFDCQDLAPAFRIVLVIFCPLCAAFLPTFGSGLPHSSWNCHRARLRLILSNLFSCCRVRKRSLSNSCHGCVSAKLNFHSRRQRFGKIRSSVSTPAIHQQQQVSQQFQIKN